MSELAEVAASNKARWGKLAAQGVSVQGVAEHWWTVLLEAIAVGMVGPGGFEDLKLAHECFLQAQLDQAEAALEEHKTTMRKAEITRPGIIPGRANGS